MRVVVLTGVGRVELRDVPDPELKNADDVRLRTACVGLCGSDLHYFAADRVAGEKVAYPAVVGHESSAVVEAVGSDVKRLRPGQRVSVDPAISCGRCDQCRAGRFHTCRDLRFLGQPADKDGCLAELFVMPERNIYPISDGMTMVEAMLAEPFAIALHAVQLRPIRAGQTMAVLGTGPIGLCVILAAQAAGVRDIFATDIILEREAAALKAGAFRTGNPRREDVVMSILADRPEGMDAVFECCGEQDALDQAVDLLKPGGTLSILGIPLAERVTFSSRNVRRKEIIIQNVRRQNLCTEKALDLIAGRHVELGFLATHDFRPEDAQAAFETAAARKDGALKTTISFDRGFRTDPYSTNRITK